MRLLPLAAAALAALPAPAALAQADTGGYTPEQCPDCATWNAPRGGLRLYGNAYWVGTQGLGSILIASDSGHVLIDGGLPESAPLIERNIGDLGFRLRDVRVLLSSHAHFDHAGGLAALERATGAVVVATEASAEVLLRGTPAVDDPQHGRALAFPGVSGVTVVGDGDTVRVGPLALVAHLTPGHSPGGTTWSWVSCEDGRCIHLVYADSQTPVSAGSFRFTDGDRALAFERGLVKIEDLRCDLLVTPHPGASGLWDRVERRAQGSADALLDPEACRRYAHRSREQLASRLAQERAGG